MTSCIGISVRRVTPPLSFSVRGEQPMSFLVTHDAPMSFLVTHDDPMEFEASRHGKAMDVYASRVSEPLSFRCGLVCSVNSHFYLEVPQETIWLIPDNDFSQDVVIYSNVSWTIE